MKDFIPSAFELQMENLTEKEETETEDDLLWQQLQYYSNHPLNLNEAGEDELVELHLLSALQIKNFLMYRKLFGNLISHYELQAVPSWDPELIRKLLPYIKINDKSNFTESLIARLKKGEHAILFRSSQIIEKAAGYQKPSGNGSYYPGSPNRMYLRYKYQYKNLLQWGLLGDKDGGEQFFKGEQKAGFDFYSFHVFARNLGLIKTLAIGDFTVNLGQGLVQWQSLAFKKGGEPVAVKRQSPVLRPYNSAGEFNFYRGIGLTLQKGNWNGACFISFRNISANKEADPLTNEVYISSISSSGYHRTVNEAANKGNVKQFSAGARLAYTATRLNVAINVVHHHLSSPVLKQDHLYNLFSLKGRACNNASVDYSYTNRNMHFFGETAVDQNLKKAFMNGLLLTVDPKVDLTLVYRSIDKSYQSMYANAFTENTIPVNENGIYAGISIRPFHRMTIGAYADFFRFPWLKYRVDAPSEGREYCMLFGYMPSKQVEITSRYRKEWKSGNSSGLATTNKVVKRLKESWRLHSSICVHPAITLRNRLEVNWYDKKGPEEETGFLVFADVLYKPLTRLWSGNLRLESFETEGYNSRLYAYENDVMYDSSIPPLYEKGFRYYFNLSYDLSRICRLFISKKLTMQCWLKFAQTLYPGKKQIGSGLDTINSSRKSEIKIQLVMRL